MYKQQQHKKHRRRGAVAPFAAVLCAFLLGMVAFAVDIGWIVLTKHQLQNAADAAALAGIDPLMDGFVNYSLASNPSDKNIILTDSMTKAKKLAKEFASYNMAGGKENLELLDADIEFGFQDDKGKYTAVPTYKGFPNTVKVVLRRDKSANGRLDLFFGQVLGLSETDVDARASATAMGGTVVNFKKTPGKNIGMLPITFDVKDWDHFVATGESPDGNIYRHANGVAQINIYPVTKDKGNFGMLSLNDSHVGASTMADWIHNGMRASDISALEANGHLPLSQRDMTKWDWNGVNGFKAANVMDINEYVGQEFILPLFKAFSYPDDSGSSNSSGGNGKGNGNNNNSSSSVYQAGVGQGSKYDYNIVRFVGIRVAEPDRRNRDVILQPAPFVDTSVIFAGKVGPMGTPTADDPSGFTTTYTTPQLTR